MSKKDDFKAFISTKPELVEFIKNKEMTMQSFYEIYDIYGENEEAWKPYLRESHTSSSPKITDVIKNINLDDVQKHINTAQKALGAVGEFAENHETNLEKLVKGPLTSRPLNKFFED